MLNLIKRLLAGTGHRLPAIPGHVTRSCASFLDALNIPEPTRSLLFTTEEDTSKIQSASEIRIELTVTLDGTTSNVDNGIDYFKEPSLIWTRLPVQKNGELESAKLYYPSYARLSPKQRYQYITWLSDITQETNLSYVFLYYYGLERHLLVGNYDGAVDEIVRLVKYHNKGSFKYYAASALLAASVYHKRPDVLERAPFVMESVDNLGLLLRLQTGMSLRAEELMQIATAIGFKNKRYFKIHPERYQSTLQHLIDTEVRNNGEILSRIDTDKLYKRAGLFFANTSVPNRVRSAEVPQIIEDELFKSICHELLQKAHSTLKNELKDENRRSTQK